MNLDTTIRLSFGDYKCVRRGTRTLTNLTSYFKQENFDKIFNQLGFTTLPEPVLNILKKYGYTYDYKLGGWKTTTSGIVMLQPGDEDNQEKANNMSITKAKTKAYKKASDCIYDIYMVFSHASFVTFNSSNEIDYNLSNELVALEKCLKTGYCDPNK